MGHKQCIYLYSGWNMTILNTCSLQTESKEVISASRLEWEVTLVVNQLYSSLNQFDLIWRTCYNRILTYHVQLVECDFKIYVAFTFAGHGSALILLRSSYSHKRALSPRGNVLLKVYRGLREGEQHTQRVLHGKRALHACWLLFLIIVKHQSASFISAGWGSGLWQRKKKEKRRNIYIIFTSIYSSVREDWGHAAMHTKTSLHTRTHTCTHTGRNTHNNSTHTHKRRKFNFPQLNSIPDVLAVDRPGGVAVPHFQKHTPILNVFS